MPQTRKQSAPDLGIQVEGHAHFAPGDTICGTVDRTSHVVTPHATVTVTLHGRAKAKVSPFERNDTTYYRSDFRLFNPRATTLTVLDGPLHIEQGGEPATWPFAIDIPRFVDPALAQRSGEPQEASYEPLGRDDRPLPETFAFEDAGFTSSVDAYVEYYLEARLSIFHKGWSRARDAIFPVVLATPRSEPPVADFDVRPQRCFNLDKFLSHRLVPGCENMRLSSSQKVKRFFHSRQVPCLAIEYTVEAPSIIQLDNPTPVPFFLRARPRWDMTSEILREIPQKIRVDYVRVEIVSHTEAKAMGSLSAHSASGSSRVTLGRYSHVNDRQAHLPFLPDDPPLNIGELMDLKIGHGRRFGTGLSGRLYADFTAFNIKHCHHQMKWSVHLSIAGEEAEITVTRQVKILPASGGSEGVGGADPPPPPFVARRRESWVVPPPESEAPPAYCPTDKTRGDVAGESPTQG